MAAFLDKGTYHSKPDTLSNSYELRRLKLRRAQSTGKEMETNLDWPETDFYEYYWAHQMYGTTVSHVVAWLVRTLCIILGSRPGLRLSATDRVASCCVAGLAWGLTFIAIGVLCGQRRGGFETNPADAPGGPCRGGRRARPDSCFLHPPEGTEGCTQVGSGCRSRFRRRCRALSGRQPEECCASLRHPARRHSELLKKLHVDRDERGDDVMYRYGRIVLVGHSLGSVIAYDILRHYWGEVNGRIDVSNIDVNEVEAFNCATSGSPPDDAKPYSNANRFRQAQCQLWKNISDRVPAGERLRRDDLWRRRASDEIAAMTPAGDQPPPDWQPARWLVSDLVTLGSPLAHAPALLARGTEDLTLKIELRELPICPPDRSRNLRPGHFVVDLSAESERLDAYEILHHGACFALTRWTNFWYPNDPVGGPLRAHFGCGIDNMKNLPDALAGRVAREVLATRTGGRVVQIEGHSDRRTRAAVLPACSN